MRNEAGFPTKPQEIKNKTSKLEDHILNQQITLHDIGAVVHYKPFKLPVKSISDFQKYLPMIWNSVYQEIKHKIIIFLLINL